MQIAKQQTNFEKHDTESIDVVHFAKHLRRSPLPVRVAIHISSQTNVGNPVREVGFGPTELEAEDPWFRNIERLF
jgi:hypothetical protein